MGERAGATSTRVDKRIGTLPRHATFSGTCAHPGVGNPEMTESKSAASGGKPSAAVPGAIAAMIAERLDGECLIFVA